MDLIQKIITYLPLLMVTVLGTPITYANQYAHGNFIAPTVITPSTLRWGTFDAFPPGAVAAIVYGDPRQPGFFMLRVKIPANYKVPPNWQTVKIFVTVL